VRAVQRPGREITLTGSLPLFSRGPGTSPGREIRLRAHSDSLDLGFVPLFLSELPDVSGTLAFDVAITGDPSDPSVTGWMVVTGASARSEALNQTFQRVEADVRLAPQRLLIDRCEVESPRGLLLVSGEVALSRASVEGLDLRLQADAFEAMNRPELNMALGADLRLTGSPSAPQVTGEARLDRAVVRLSDFIEAPPDPESIWRTVPFFADMVADVQVSAAKNVWFRDQDLNVEIEGDVDLRKKGQDLRLYGSLASRQGRYEFVNRSFRIDKGEIQFQGRPELDPDVYIIGETRQRIQGGESTDIRVIVGGTLLHPQISVESDHPDLTKENDILSYLAFGRPADFSDEDGEAPSIEGQARGLVLGLAANRLKQSIGDELGLDVVEIDMGDEGNVARVRVGKYIGSRLFVTYARDIASPGTELSVEYELLPWLTLEAEQRPQEEGKPDRQRLGIVWKTEW